LFPDPWPKKKHASRRFVNPENLQELARLIKKGGILQIATDHAVYKRWVMEQMRKNKDFIWTAKCSNDWRNPPADWHETKYQRKAIREGRKPVFFEYQRI
jgi:tRNA (guanine-N7-)-methyltransferase